MLAFCSISRFPRRVRDGRRFEIAFCSIALSFSFIPLGKLRQGLSCFWGWEHLSLLQVVSSSYVEVLRQISPRGSQPLGVTRWGTNSLGAASEVCLTGWKLLHVILAHKVDCRHLQASWGSFGGAKLVQGRACDGRCWARPYQSQSSVPKLPYGLEVAAHTLAHNVEHRCLWAIWGVTEWSLNRAEGLSCGSFCDVGCGVGACQSQSCMPRLPCGLEIIVCTFSSQGEAQGAEGHSDLFTLSSEFLFLHFVWISCIYGQCIT